MRAVRIRGRGGPDVLELVDVEAPPLWRGAVRVRVKASALNRADVLQRRGFYPAPPGTPADIPGLEFVGEVSEVADPEVTRWEIGDRVMGIVAGGAHAEEVVVHGRELIRAPRGVDDVRAAAIPEAFMTAWDALVIQASMKAGDTVLVHAAGSGVGTAAIQLVRAAGAIAIGSSRTAVKLERCGELGMTAGVDTSGGFGRAEATEVTRLATEHGHGQGVHVVLDLVGGAYLSANLQAMARGAKMVTIGLLGGVKGDLNLGAVLSRRLTLMGSTLRSRPIEEKIGLARRFEREVVPRFESGELVPVVDRTLPMTDIAAAHQVMESNSLFGKIVLTW